MSTCDSDTELFTRPNCYDGSNAVRCLRVPVSCTVGASFVNSRRSSILLLIIEENISARRDYLLASEQPSWSTFYGLSLSEERGFSLWIQ